MTLLQKWLGVDTSLPEQERGQAVINRVFGASPENPVELPIKSVPVNVSLDPETQITILGGFAMVAVAWILTKYIIK
jgi:hypothetical protein